MVKNQKGYREKVRNIYLSMTAVLCNSMEPLFLFFIKTQLILKSVYLIATRDLSNLWLQFFLSQNQGFMRLFEKTVLK